MLTVTTPASDPTLLTAAEVAEATGIAVSDSAKINRVNSRVSEIIAAACNIPRAGAAILTLREETLTETVRFQSGGALYLSRKPIVSVVSVKEGDTELSVEDFEIENERCIRRIKDGELFCWTVGKIEVVYKAGFAVVPPMLKELAAKLATVINAETGRDPSLGSVDIPGVISETYRFGRPDDPLVPAEIMQGLINGGFVHHETMIG